VLANFEAKGGVEKYKQARVVWGEREQHGSRRVQEVESVEQRGLALLWKQVLVGGVGVIPR
jgi:hypothetical protein